MRRFGWVVVLVAVSRADAPAEPRQPVLPRGAPRDSGDAVADHVHALLAGTAVRNGAIAFVPLHARTPAEARRPGERLPRWTADKLAPGSPVRGVLRLRPSGTRPLLVVPGRTWALAGTTHRSREVALLEAGRPGFVRVAAGPRGAAGEPGWIGPGATGALLSEPGRMVAPGAFTTARLERDPRFRSCEAATRGLERSGDGTLAGCVALVGGRPAIAYVMGDARVWAAARRDFVALAVEAERVLVRNGEPEALLRQRASRVEPRGRAVALLRRLCGADARTRDVPGAGFRWHAEDGSDVARALVDGSGRLVFFGAWRVAPRLAAAEERAGPAPAVRSGEEETDDLRRRRARRPGPAGKEAKPLPPPLPGG